MSNSSNEFVVHEQLDALARGQLAALVLRLDALLAAAAARAVAPLFELVENVFHDPLLARFWRPPAGRMGMGDS